MNQPTPQWRLRQMVKTLERLAAEVIDPSHAEALQSHAEGLWTLAAEVTPKAPSNALTPAQARVLDFVRQHIERRGQAPTRKEISMAFGYSSANAAEEHLRALERKGHLTRTDRESRNLRVNS